MCVNVLWSKLKSDVRQQHAMDFFYAISCTSDVGGCRVAQQIMQQKSEYEHALLSATCCEKAVSRLVSLCFAVVVHNWYFAVCTNSITKSI